MGLRTIHVSCRTDPTRTPEQLDDRLSALRPTPCQAAVRRLTRIQARSVEEPVAAEDGDDIYNWPWLYAVEVGHWDLTDLQAAKLRDFLNRGGFFMCDDFHGTWEWEMFVASMKKVFPNRPIVDIPNTDPIFHTVYDLDDRYQVPGRSSFIRTSTYEKDGY